MTDLIKTDTYTLSSIQTESVKRLRTMKACIIALSTGVGKTLMLLHRTVEILNENPKSKFIIIIPKSARASFVKEMTTRICKPFILLKAGTEVSLEDLSSNNYIIIENSVLQRYEDLLITLTDTFDCTLIIDEAHSLQNPKSIFTKTAWNIRVGCKQVFLMTATPLLNDIEGLYNVYFFAFPKAFSSWEKFRNRYCITKSRTIYLKNHKTRNILEIVGYQNLDELSSILDKVTLKGCVSYNVNFKFLECDLDERSESLYTEASKGLMDVMYHPEKVKKDSGDSESKKDFGARLHDLQRVVDGYELGDGDNFISNKIRMLCKEIRNITSKNESTLVYSEYLDTLDYIEVILARNKDLLGIKNIYKLTGAEKEDYRVKVETGIEAGDVILCSPAASQSRNLQRSNNILVFNVPFSIGRVVQLVGRICRMDTTFDVQNIIFLTVKKTIDDYKITLLKSHLSLIDKLLGKEVEGTLSECEYLDIDNLNIKSLKDALLWRKK